MRGLNESPEGVEYEYQVTFVQFLLVIEIYAKTISRRSIDHLNAVTDKYSVRPIDLLYHLIVKGVLLVIFMGLLMCRSCLFRREGF